MSRTLALRALGAPALLLALWAAGAVHAGPAEDCAYEEGDPAAEGTHGVTPDGVLARRVW